jgi:hypothetical protein
MPLSTGRSKLFNAMKALRGQWRRVQDVWDDPVRREFDEHTFTPLDEQVQAELRATDRLDQLLSQFFRDCE